MGEQKEILMEG